MVLISRRRNKITGSIFILFGIFCIIYLFYSKTQILNQYSFFIARYFKILLFGYIGFFSVASGVLYFIGFLTPYYAANPYEKAKSYFWESILSFPIFVLMLIVAVTSLIDLEIRAYRVLAFIFSCVLVVVNVWTFIYGSKTLKKYHSRKYRT